MSIWLVAFGNMNALVENGLVNSSLRVAVNTVCSANSLKFGNPLRAPRMNGIPRTW